MTFSAPSSSSDASKPPMPAADAQRLESQPHHRALRWLASSHLLVVSSVMEGGANVVSEAIAAGTPVIASFIPGNVGLLGDDWPALFPVGDAQALAGLLRRLTTDPAFLALLREAIRARAWIADPAQEQSALATAIEAARVACTSAVT
jgi:glycosyltransferase involved in cell wall biosynthesis